MTLLRIETIVTNPLLRELGGPPRRATKGAAALDLIACEKAPVTIPPMGTYRFDLGFNIYIGNPAWSAWILPRSGLGSNAGLVLANTVGLIDSDYQGPLAVVALNRQPAGGEAITVRPGDRIFQMVFVPVALAELAEVQSFSESTDRGHGGYGSTGI